MNDLSGQTVADDVSASLWYILQHLKAHSFPDTCTRIYTLKLLMKMRMDGHPSGHPAPEDIFSLAYSIRQEKLRLVRTTGRDGHTVAEVQHVIDVLKRMHREALQLRPAVLYTPTWREKWTDTGNVMLPVLSLTVPLLQCMLSLSPSIRAFTLLGLTGLTLLTSSRSYIQLPSVISLIFITFFSLFNALNLIQ